ncbi:MAG: hypothetical protein RUMPE_00620 [Eubacteriales bacterium SKADARSKE-1]|nr:hypothetical protein [Eubacteriales bacterium SKADARSKE-1]
MFKPSIDDMMSGKKSRYALVIGVAKRAREIADDMVKTSSTETEKSVNLAIKDFKEHKYEILEQQINE